MKKDDFASNVRIGMVCRAKAGSEGVEGKDALWQLFLNRDKIGLTKEEFRKGLGLKNCGKKR